MARSARSRALRRGARPGVEILEDRNLLSGFTLNGFIPNPFIPGTAVADLTRVQALGDLNGDGFPDLVQAETLSRIAVFLNTGAGSFGVPPQVLTTSSAGVAEIVLGDFNGDGKPDVAALLNVGNTSGSIDVFLNNGDGTFPTNPSSTISLGAGNWIDLAAGDFNSDGHLDLAALNANSGAAGVEVALNPGTGDFSTGTPLKVATSGTASVALDAGNFDTGAAVDKGAQFLDDLIVLEKTATGNQVETLLSNNDSATAPTFVSKTTALAPAETYQDVVSTISSKTQTNAATVDLNHDGKADIAVIGNVTTASGTVSQVETYGGNNDGTFGSGGVATPLGTLPLSGRALTGGFETDTIVFGDFNGDGFVDVAATTNGGSNGGFVDVGLNDGHGGLVPNPQGPLHVPNTSQLYKNDVNDQNRADLIAAYSSMAGGGDTIFLNTSVAAQGAGAVSFLAGVPSGPAVVATFTADRASATAGQFNATITWGDGTASPGTVVQPAAGSPVFQVVGSHTYAAAGSFSIAVTVNDVAEQTSGVASAQTKASAASTAVVAPATIPNAATPAGTDITGLFGISVGKASRHPHNTAAPLKFFEVPVTLINNSGETVTGARMLVLGLRKHVRLKRESFTGTTSGVPGVPNGTPFVDFAVPASGSVTVSLHVAAPMAGTARRFSVRILAGD